MFVLKKVGEQAVACNLEAPKLAVGRDISNDFVLNEPSVSGFHALILREHGRSIVADLGSTNGCFVNGQRITGRAEFSTGDRLAFGTVNFEVGLAAVLPETTVAMPAMSAMSADGGRPETFARETPVPPASPTGDKFCPQCGAHAGAEARFCVKCGNPFSNFHPTASAGAGGASPGPGDQTDFVAPHFPPQSPLPNSSGLASGIAKSAPTPNKKWAWMGLASAAASAAAVTGGWLLLNKPSDPTAGQIGQATQLVDATLPQSAPAGDAFPPLQIPAATPKSAASPRPTPSAAAVSALPMPMPMQMPVPAQEAPLPMPASGLIEESYSTPPPLTFASPPDFIVAPSDNDYIYMAAGLTGLYFLGGQWYRHHNGHWFRSPDYNGRWSYMNRLAVPPSILRVPPEYPRHIHPSYQHIPYTDLNRSWRHWDQQKHWNNQPWYRNELRDDVRKDRLRSIERERAVEHERNKPVAVPPRLTPPGPTHTPPQHGLPSGQPTPPHQPQTHGIPGPGPAPHQPPPQTHPGATPPSRPPSQTMPPPTPSPSRPQSQPMQQPPQPHPATPLPPSRPQSQSAPPQPPQHSPALPPPSRPQPQSQPPQHQPPPQAPAMPPPPRPQPQQQAPQPRPVTPPPPPPRPPSQPVQHQPSPPPAAMPPPSRPQNHNGSSENKRGDFRERH